MGEEKKISNEEIYKLLQCHCNQMKGEFETLKEQITALNSTVAVIRSENAELKVKNTILEKQILVLKRQARENNLIFYNFPETEAVPLLTSILAFIKSSLDIGLEYWEVNSVYRIGKTTGKNRPVIIKLTSNIKKRHILAGASKLKNTGVSVAEDLVEEDRVKQKKLYEHYRAAKSKGYPAKLLTNKVIINGKQYQYKDLEGTVPTPSEETAGYNRPGHRKSVSAPTSPLNTECLLHGDPQRAQTGDSVYQTEIINSEVFEEEKGASGQGAIPKQHRIPSIETRSRSNSKSSSAAVNTTDNKKGSRK